MTCPLRLSLDEIPPRNSLNVELVSMTQLLPKGQAVEAHSPDGKLGARRQLKEATLRFLGLSPRGRQLPSEPALPEP